MRTVGFSGKSGTGKSYRALSVASENGIKLIIDDGLLICNGKILAGKSAKREKNPYASTLRAIFNDPEHSKSVADAIVKSGECSILILGTSEKMVNLIADRVGVAPVDKHIHIDEVATDEEISKAVEMRSKGKHVIPVPSIEIKRSFSGYLMDPITSIKRLADGFFDKSSQPERTIIRPAYGYLGEFDIAESILCKIAEHEAKNHKAVASVVGVAYYGNRDKIRIELSLYLGADFQQTCMDIQKKIIDSIDVCTSVYIDTVDITVSKAVTKKN